MSRMRDGRNVPGPGDYYGNPPEEKFCHCGVEISESERECQDCADMRGDYLYDQRKDEELFDD